MTLYLDTSALVKLLVAEDGSDAVHAAASEASELVASHVTYVEIHSMLAIGLLDAGSARFASWDEPLNVAAARERLELIPLL